MADNRPTAIMNAPLLPEIFSGISPDFDQAALPLATEGVQRYVWQSAFGQILIEVRDGVAFVNGERVQSIADPEDTPRTA